MRISTSQLLYLVFTVLGLTAIYARDYDPALVVAAIKEILHMTLHIKIKPVHPGCVKEFEMSRWPILLLPIVRVC